VIFLAWSHPDTPLGASAEIRERGNRMRCPAFGPSAAPTHFSSSRLRLAQGDDVFLRINDALELGGERV
jgi:hypothetical protein